MILAILIPTLPDRAEFLKLLTDEIRRQIIECNATKHVKVFVDARPRGPVTTGEKRNWLNQEAYNEGFIYGWHIDDDDIISPRAINLVLNAAMSSPDVIGINGWMTTDGANRVDWEIRLGHPYINSPRDGKDYYLRHPNHITPMKLKHAVKIKFPHITLGEDYQWAKALNDAGYLKTQEVIEEKIYHYQCRTKK